MYATMGPADALPPPRSDGDVLDLGGERFRVRGRWRCWLTNPDGSRDGDDFFLENGVTTPGCNYLLDVGFRAQSQLASWYAGLINASGFTSVSANDTAASHAGWTEFTGYSDSTRRQWSPGAASAGVLINATAMSFTINASGSVQGIFVISDNTKGGTSGTLWSTATEASPRTVTSGQAFNAIYELTLTPVS
jgi:hypothetical protein